jgi:hypothetical protein
MKEYRIQLWLENGCRWVNIREFVMHPFSSLADAKWELDERKREHPDNKYRIIERTVSEWKEVD